MISVSLATLKGRNLSNGWLTFWEISRSQTSECLTPQMEWFLFLVSDDVCFFLYFGVSFLAFPEPVLRHFFIFEVSRSCNKKKTPFCRRQTKKTRCLVFFGEELDILKRTKNQHIKIF